MFNISYGYGDQKIAGSVYTVQFLISSRSGAVVGVPFVHHSTFLHKLTILHYITIIFPGIGNYDVIYRLLATR